MLFYLRKIEFCKNKKGFDVIAASGLVYNSFIKILSQLLWTFFYNKGEELVNPKKNMPLSILVTLVVSGVLYVSLSVVLTLMMPYYLADSGILLIILFYL
jgi:amino acid transporter